METSKEDFVMFEKWKKGFTGFELKYIALVLMVFDHIHYIFEYTGRIPLWFSWIGRLAAPLFLFCMIEGFLHTHDRKKYFLKIYAVAAVMGVIRFSFYNLLAGLVRADGFIPLNAMLSSFVVLFVVLQGISWCEQKRFFLGIPAIVVPMILPYLVQLFVFQPLLAREKNTALFFVNLIVMAFVPLHAMIADGGTAILLQGIVLYVFHKSRKKQMIAFTFIVVLWDILRLFFFVPNLTAHGLIFEYYEWMEILSVPLMLCYNGERGKGNGHFFYLFYPLHIYVLYALSFFLMR